VCISRADSLAQLLGSAHYIRIALLQLRGARLNLELQRFGQRPQSLLAFAQGILGAFVVADVARRAGYEFHLSGVVQNRAENVLVVAVHAGGAAIRRFIPNVLALGAAGSRDP